MKKIINIAIVALLFASCDYNGENFPGYDSKTPTDIKKLDYTMVEADYKTVANNAANKTLATENNVANELKAVETNKTFNNAVLAQDYAPALLATLFPTADESSAIRLTYNYQTGSIINYKLTSADYTQVWNGISTVGALTPAKSSNTVIPALLTVKYPAAKEGDVRIVEYEYSAVEPGQNVSTITSFVDDFEAYEAGSGKAVPTTSGFVVNKDVKGAIFWQCRTYNSNKYVQVTSNNSGAENEAWLITKQIDLSAATDNASFTFDINAGYVNANILNVLVSENFNGTEAGIATATWMDITSNFTVPTTPASGYGTLGTAGTMDFKAYAGKKVYVAFKYSGNGVGNAATTTYQIDNVIVSYTAVSTVVPSTETHFGYFKYTGGAWSTVTKSVYQLTADDYTAMGKTSISTADAPKYLPTLLKEKFPYAQEGNVKLVAFKTSASTYSAAEYIFSKGVWSPASYIESRTDQFVRTGGKWVYNPSVTINLSPIRNEPTIVSYYQAAVDWVWENIDVPAGCATKGQGYVTSYANDDKFGGVSAYYNNIDHRAASARQQTSASPIEAIKNAYPANWTDQQVQDKMKENLILELNGMLQKKHPDAVPVSGIVVIYTINIPIYTGVTLTANNYTIQYKVTGTGEFEYVEDSLKPIQ